MRVERSTAATTGLLLILLIQGYLRHLHKPQHWAVSDIMAFAVKLGILVVKSVTKPFAKRIKNTQDKDLQHFCRRVGQAQNKIITLVNLRMSGIKAKKVKELPDEQALSLGAELVSEVLYLVSVGHYWRWNIGDETSWQRKRS